VRNTRTLMTDELHRNGLMRTVRCRHIWWGWRTITERVDVSGELTVQTKAQACG
jgi:hypothetical protein